MIKYLFIGSLSCFALCCSDAVGPASVRSPRDYTWDATNLANPSIPTPQMLSIWGSSNSDVYACGDGLRNGVGEVYHFDGKSWHPLTISLGANTYYELNQLTGFSRDDIWAVGSRLYPGPGTIDSALVIHFDGAKWASMLSSHMGVAGLRRIWGFSGSNLYCGSRDGKLIHFDGGRWTVEVIYPHMSINAIGGDRDRLFVSGNTYAGNDSVLCYSKTSGPWQLVDVRTTLRTILAFYSPRRGDYYAATSDGIFRWDDGWWQRSLSTYAWISDIKGTGPNNILAVGLEGSTPMMYHFDGSSWAAIEPPPEIFQDGFYLTSVWINDTDAFAICDATPTSFVIHGQRIALAQDRH
jgi:hypothetical protein